MQKGRFIKAKHARLLCILLSLALLLTACAGGPVTTKRFNADTVQWVHLDELDDTYTYAGDLDAEKAQLEGWLNSEGNWSEIQQYLDDLTQANLKIRAAYGLQDIYATKDVYDINAQNETKQLEDLAEKLYEHQLSMLKMIADSSYVNDLSKTYGNDLVSVVREWEIQDLDIPEENSIIQQRQRAFVSDYHFTYKGEDWTFHKLWSSSEVSDEDYFAIRDGLCAKKNKALGELLLSLVEARNTMVQSQGLAEYPELMNQSYSFRDYSLDDILGLCEQVKQSAIPQLFKKVTDTYYANIETFQELGEANTQSDRNIFQQITDITSKRSETIGKIASGLQENELYFYDTYEDGAYTPFMQPLKAYGLGVIYLPKGLPEVDAQTLYHEFGHFCNVIIDAPKGNVEMLRSLYIDNQIPTELDSFGMETLFMQDYENLYGEDGNIFRLYYLQYVLHSILTSALYSEFEISLYRDPPKSVEEANERFAGLEEAYGGNAIRADIPKGMTWAEVPHYFTSPLYYPNYMTAMIPTIGSMLNSKETIEEQYDRYIRLMEIGGSLLYRELLKEVGMKDPFHAGVVETLSSDLEKYVDEMLADLHADTP